jgi:hypothetical protein
MKSIIWALRIILIFLGACKKDNSIPSYASINVVNASVGAGTVKINFGESVSWASYVGTMGAVNYGTNQIVTAFNLISDYPLKIVSALDSLNVVFNQKIGIVPDGRYSLYTTGQTGTYDAIFVKELTIPYNMADSSVAIRFINLSPNSPSVSITLASSPAVYEVSGLTYKQVTEFKNYKILKTIPAGSLTFQVRDLNTNTILTSYTLPQTPVMPYNAVSTTLSRFKSVTLAIKGLTGIATGTNSYSIFPIANY